MRKQILKRKSKLYLEDLHWVHVQSEFSQFLQNLWRQHCEEQSVRLFLSMLVSPPEQKKKLLSSTEINHKIKKQRENKEKSTSKKQKEKEEKKKNKRRKKKERKKTIFENLVFEVNIKLLGLKKNFDKFFISSLNSIIKFLIFWSLLFFFFFHLLFLFSWWFCVVVRQRERAKRETKNKFPFF